MACECVQPRLIVKPSGRIVCEACGMPESAPAPAPEVRA